MSGVRVENIYQVMKKKARSDIKKYQLIQKKDLI